jgi:hypothetical protein
MESSQALTLGLRTPALLLGTPSKASGISPAAAGQGDGLPCQDPLSLSTMLKPGGYGKLGKR